MSNPSSTPNSGESPAPPPRLRPNKISNASDDELRDAVERLENHAVWGGILVIAGVVAELLLAWWNQPVGMFANRWGPAIADGTIALGVAIEVVCGKMASNRQGELLARSETRLAEATTKLSRLTEQMAPRSMTAVQHQSLADNLKSLKGHRVYIAVAPDLPESQMFARMLFGALVVAGLDVVFPAQATRMPLYPGGLVVGFNNNPGSQPAALVIAQALKAAGIYAAAFPGEGDDNQTWPSYVLITVGMKPDQDAVDRLITGLPAPTVTASGPNHG